MSTETTEAIEVKEEITMNPTTEDFSAMFESTSNTEHLVEGRVVPATVQSIENDYYILDFGLKTEGRVPSREFAIDEKKPSKGDIVDVYLERIENALGEAVLSREKARREENWQDLEAKFNDKEQIRGTIMGRVKGGFTVTVGEISAFLPGSQVDIRPIRDIAPLMDEPQPFVILKMDRVRGNIVVSRRAILEESRAEQRAELVGEMAEGDIRDGVVKNITDYGAFVDLGGIDGLLHVTDMSWKRVNHPTQVVSVGDAVKVQIIKINPESHRISLGMKQLGEDPWAGVEKRYIVGSRQSGSITNITEYGAFVEVEDGIEGLIHVSEMSWTKKNVHPSKIVSPEQKVEVVVLDVDSEKRRISLGMKQAKENPWQIFCDENPIGTIIEGEIRGITEFGLFVGIGKDIDGMVHIQHLSWDEPGEKAIEKYNKGESVKVKVLDIDVEKERVSLGVKQVDKDTVDSKESKALRKGSVVTCVVTEVTANGIGVTFGDPQMSTFIRRSDLSRARGEQRPERFAPGDKVDAKITRIDKAKQNISLSIKELEIAEEKAAVEQYGSADSGAVLGDILGEALAASQSKDKSSDASPDTDDSEPGAKPLTSITGLGPAAEKKLKAAGVNSVEDLVALDEEGIQRIESETKLTGKLSKWIELVNS